MATALDIGVENVLNILTDVYKIEGKVAGNEYTISCPNPAHDDRHPSCSVNLDTGLWNCFSCGTGGDLIKLGMVLLDEDYDSIKDRITGKSQSLLLARIKSKLSTANIPDHRTVKATKLGPYENGPLTALTSRGFERSILEKWGLRFVPEEIFRRHENAFSVKNAIGIPLQDENGLIISWIYRATPSSPAWQPKYLYAPSFPLSEVWYGLRFNSSAEEILVVEGALDVIWLDQAGIPAIASLGANTAMKKLRQLYRYKRVILLFDKDPAGVGAVNSIGAAIYQKVPVLVARYPKGSQASDPVEMTPEELERSRDRAIPWLAWREKVGKKFSETFRQSLR